MTGAEHFQAAENALDQALKMGVGTDQERYCLAEAQIHATLALAAATALQHYNPEGMPREDAKAWYAACGIKAPAPAVKPVEGEAA